MSDPYHWIHPISHEDVNQWVTILQTEKSRHHEYHFNQSQDPSHQEMVFLASPDIGYKMIQMLEIKSINLTNSNSVRFFKWCQLFSPFFCQEMTERFSFPGIESKYIYYMYMCIYIYIFMFRQQKTQQCWVTFNWMVAGDHLIGFHCWILSQWMNGSSVENGWCLLHPELTSFQWGVFGVSSWHALPSTSSATPPPTPPDQLNGFVPRLLFSFLVHLLEDVRILENIREHHPMPRFASKPMALKYITIHLRNIYLKSYIIWPIFHKLFSFSKATWSRLFFPHKMHLKPHLTTSNNTKPSPYYPYTIHPSNGTSNSAMQPPQCGRAVILPWKRFGPTNQAKNSLPNQAPPLLRGKSLFQNLVKYLGALFTTSF